MNNIPIILISILLLISPQGCTRKNAIHEFEIYNNTDEIIILCKLKENYSNGRTKIIKNIKPGTMKSTLFDHCRAECGVIISFITGDGKKITSSPIGYLTFSWSSKYLIYINADKSISCKVKKREMGK